MSSIIANNNNIILYSIDKMFVFNTINNNTTEIKLPPIEIPSNLSENQEKALRSEKCIIQSTAFSQCGKYFAVCTVNKQLVIFNSQFEVLSNLVIQRAVSKIRFTPFNNIVIADKTGDVYLFNLENNNKDQLLGHLSMLLDVIVSADEKYIITCDRDEKIRVSHFPGSYDIVSYCLGHEEFVLNLEFYKPDVLISSSGDGTIRFWNYIEGNQIQMINTNDYVKDTTIVEKFSEFMDGETVDVNCLPITNMKVKTMNNKSILIVSLFNFDSLQVFEIYNNIEFKLIQLLEVKYLISFDVSDKLYILTKDKIEVYEFKNEFHKIDNSTLNKFYDNCKDLIPNVVENISVLYKRKYDNVQEYQERKKLRLENSRK